MSRAKDIINNERLNFTRTDPNHWRVERRLLSGHLSTPFAEPLSRDFDKSWLVFDSIFLGKGKKFCFRSIYLGHYIYQSTSQP